MSQLCFEKTPSGTSRGALAQLGAAHGYRFDGDTVCLNAMFRVIDPGAHGRSWALQLWACPTAPSAGVISGHLVAQPALPPIGEIADETHSFEVSAPATTPAGTGEFVMVLALVSGRGREFNELRDFAVYPRRDHFLAPRLAGPVSYNISGNRVRISVARVENPRPRNLSGSLALELWALPVRYDGGAFHGAPLAGIALNPLAAGSVGTNWSFDLPFVAPPAGQWNIVLMLREWTASGFVTRDFTNFDAPYVQAAPRPAASAPTANAQASSARPETATRAEPIAKPESKTAEIKAAASDALVSINHSTVEILTQVKGFSEKAAKIIVKERPFRSIDDLAKVKGIGVKTLEKIRTRIKL